MKSVYNMVSQWLCGDASVTDPAYMRAVLAVLDRSEAPTVEQMRVLSAIQDENKKSRTVALVMAFMLGHMIGRHEERKLHRTRPTARTKRMIVALLDAMPEEKLSRALRFVRYIAGRS